MKVIILAGGSGTRLWPLSRGRYPKQFIKLQGNKPSLFQEAFNRSMLLADVDDIYVVTNEKYKFLVMGADEPFYYFKMRIWKCKELVMQVAIKFFLNISHLTSIEILNGLYSLSGS